MLYFNNDCHENKNIYSTELKLLHAKVPSLLLRKVYKYLLLLLFLHVFSYLYWSPLPALYLVLLLLLLTNKISTQLVNIYQYPT